MLTNPPSIENGISPTSYEQLLRSVPQGVLDHARDIGLSLLRSFAERPSYVLGVTSAMRGEGKSTISAGLADVMSTDFGLQVVLIDAHAERPWSQHPDTPGLGEWLTGACELTDALQNVHDKCHVLPFGSTTVTSRDILQYMTRTDALAELRYLFNLVVLDLPDLLHPAAAALASRCDGLVLVVRSGDTPADRVSEFVQLLGDVTIHGVVLNRHRSAIPAWLRRFMN